MPVITALPDRAVLRLSGTDRYQFLQGLITNDLSESTAETGVFAALLTAQGRFLHEFFVVASLLDESLLIDCWAQEAEALARRLLVYRMRAKAEIVPAPNLAVAMAEGLYQPQTAVAAVLRDCRFKTPMTRVIGEVSDDFPALDSGIFEAFERQRISDTIPDSRFDLVAEKSLIMEMGYERMGAISWTKGCYIGQELTARMKHRALTKRQIATVTSPLPLPALGEPYLHDGEEIGTMLASRCPVDNGWMGLISQKV